jgi:hypothetical protein
VIDRDAQHMGPEAGTEGRARADRGQAPPKGPWLEDLGAVGLELVRWLRLRAERTRLALRRRLFEIAWALPLVAFGLAVAVLAGAAFARGVIGGALALFERAPWLGEIVAGLTLLGGLLAVLHLWMRASDARELERLRREHEDDGASTPHPGPDA